MLHQDRRSDSEQVSYLSGDSSFVSTWWAIDFWCVLSTHLSNMSWNPSNKHNLRLNSTPVTSNRFKHCLRNVIKNLTFYPTMGLCICCEVLLAEQTKAEGLLCMISDRCHISSSMGIHKGSCWYICLKENDLYGCINFLQITFGLSKDSQGLPENKTLLIHSCHVL